MSYSKVNYHDVERVEDAMHFLREPLDTEQVGVTIARCKPGWIGRKHDHTDNKQEEVYILIDGEATVTVDGEDVRMGPGDALWISSDATRQIRNGDEESAFVLVSAPEFTETGDDSEWSLRGFTG
ncbi:cupin domain-containing protein [Halegenticoccus tardaugens]|uniref:cupin domain-containing protein n=1 Tax=Halegenticoccus tardaugens TaxID=2071624 RepID=UPI00100BC0EA|nr:cupin domain-containing protein [Halegenticoccus tardaugens]